MPPLKVAVIGTGSIGNVHLTGYAANPKLVTIHAIADVNQARLDEMGEKFGVPRERRYRDYNKMLAAEPLDAVSVCTPNKFHFPAATAVVKAGCHLLLEKPVVLDATEARALRKSIAAAGVKSMVAFSHRFFEPNIAAKKLLDKGAIGKPFMIRVRFAHNGPYPGWAQSDWFYKKNIAGGGAMLDMGIHAIDICQYLVGPIKSVMAEIRTLRKPIAVDDNAVVAMDFADQKCLGYIECGWTTATGFSGIEIYGDKGSMVLEMGKAGIIRKGITRPDGSIDYSEDVFSENPPHNWPVQMDNWVRLLHDKKIKPSTPTIEDGIRGLAVALAAMESSKKGCRVKVKTI